MTTKFTAAVLATLIGVGLTAPAFAADPVATPQTQGAAKKVEQAAPKAKHDAVKAESKAKHDGQVAKNKAAPAKPAAKDAAKTPGKTL
ncbi:MAG TPA: hypothetical protein VFS04_09110 [Alphaproteobacteria bacterium]|nr:hypothetical protein [Alphaproteobacteria bacterium]